MSLSIASLILFAPRLPPTHSTVFLLASNPKKLMPSSLVNFMWAIEFLTGFPLTIIFAAGKKFSIPSVAVKIFVAFFPSIILLFPAKELAS